MSPSVRISPTDATGVHIALAGPTKTRSESAPGDETVKGRLQSRSHAGVHMRGLRAVLLTLLVLGSGACSEVRHAASPQFQPVAQGTLTVATELPAPGFWNGADAATMKGGFEWGLAEALAKELGLQMAVREVPFADIVAGRLDGADIALAQVSATDERKNVAQLTLPYFETSPTAVARSGTEHDLVDLATAKKQRWVVQEGTTLKNYLDEVVRPDREPIVRATTDAVVNAVASGEADAGLLDLPTALTVAREKGLSVPARFDHVEPIVGVLPARTDNLQLVDQALARLLANGTVDSLRRQWLDPAFAVDPDRVPVIIAQE
jgi:polar amino acid transport system substrate-binding protein